MLNIHRLDWSSPARWGAGELNTPVLLLFLILIFQIMFFALGWPGIVYQVRGTRYEVQDAGYGVRGTGHEVRGTRYVVRGMGYVVRSTSAWYFKLSETKGVEM